MPLKKHCCIVRLCVFLGGVAFLLAVRVQLPKIEVVCVILCSCITQYFIKFHNINLNCTNPVSLVSKFWLYYVHTTLFRLFYCAVHRSLGICSSCTKWFSTRSMSACSSNKNTNGVDQFQPESIGYAKAEGYFFF